MSGTFFLMWLVYHMARMEPGIRAPPTPILLPPEPPLVTKYVGPEMERFVQEDIQKRIPGYKDYRKSLYEGTYQRTEPERLPPGTRRR